MLRFAPHHYHLLDLLLLSVIGSIMHADKVVSKLCMTWLTGPAFFIAGRVLLGSSRADSLAGSSMESTDQPLHVQLVSCSHDNQNAAPLVTFTPYKGIHST